MAKKEFGGQKSGMIFLMPNQHLLDYLLLFALSSRIALQGPLFI